jgi:aspartate aminotransferase-like enzyme
MIHHRSAAFSEELATLLDLVAPVFGARERVLPVHTTGRGAMEGAICNLFAPGDEIVACCNGKFGELWATLAESCGLIVHRVATDWAKDIAVAELEALLARRPGVRGMTLTYSDTSTGVANDVVSVAQLARAHGALVLVDGVSAIGGMPFAFDDWDVDVAVTASQKCLMSSPGLALVAMSPRAWAASRRATLPHNYWNFEEIRAAVSKARPETPGTPPVHVVLQVAEALRMMHEEGLDAVFARHERVAAQVRHGAAALGLTLQCPALARYSATVTAIAAPAAIAPAAIRAGLDAEGVLIAAALGRYEPGAFRIGHMGDIRLADVDRALTALAGVLTATPQTS